MQLPLMYLDASAMEEVPLDLWRDVFATIGWPASLGDKQTHFTHDDVREAVRTDDLGGDLLYALEILHTLGTEAGREAIVSIMSERHVQLDTLPADASERELAIRLYLAQRDNAALADVLARAQTQMHERGDRRRYNEFLAKEPKTLSGLGNHRQALYAALLRHCQASDLGDHIQVDAFDDDGVYVFSILRSDRLKKPLAVVPGQKARAVIPFRPVHGDIIRYEAPFGRLRIAARAPSMVEFYRTTLGLVLFADEDFFNGDAVCSLGVLQQRGRAALDAHGVFGVSQVRLTDCVWECGDRSRIVLRDRDCFELIERLGLSLAVGTFVEAQLRVDIIGKSTRPVVVAVRTPSRIEVSQKRYERKIEELLDAIGIRMAAAGTDQRDMWSLYPWRHSASVWRAVFGVEMDALVQQGVLGRVQLQAVAHPDYPEAGRVLRVQQISEWSFHGVSEVSEVPSRTLTATDVEGLELAPELLRQYLRTTLGVAEGGVVWSPGDEVLQLGVRSVGDERLYVAYAIREPGRDIGVRLRVCANGAHVVLLVPGGRREEAGLPTVRLEGPIPRRRQVIRDGAGACGFGERLAAIDRAPEEAELVVDGRLKKVWVCGAELQEVSPESQQFRFLEMFAASNGAPISCGAVTQALSAARLRTDGTTTARQVKMRVKKLVVQALKAAESGDTSDPFPPAGTGAYRCRLRSFVG